MYNTRLTSSSLDGPRPGQRRGAFTLVELLVVIGIIALLISILLRPWARPVSSQSASSRLSNIKQLATVAHMYVSGRTLPFSNWATARKRTSPPVGCSGR